MEEQNKNKPEEVKTTATTDGTSLSDGDVMGDAVKSEALAKEPAKKAAPAKKPKKKANPKDKLFKPAHNVLLTSSPHEYEKTSVSKIMWTVMATLLPCTLMAVYYFRMQALVLIVACTVTALITEVLANKLKGEAPTIKDGSAAITGLLLALTLPPSLPVSYAVLGSIFAIMVGKQVFGGLGYNIFNPALIGRAFIQTSFPVAITTWTFPSTERFASIDGVTAATPLGLFKFGNAQVVDSFSDMLTGNVAGSLGETSVIAILLGGAYLVAKKYADWRIPTGIIATVAIFSSIFWLLDPSQYAHPVLHVLSGGVMLGAFFMATDMVTCPITPKGAWIFAIGTGFIIMVIRLFGGLPEGVMYALLFMNALVPMINRYTRPKYLGEAK